MTVNEYPRSHGSLSGLSDTDHHIQYAMDVQGTLANRPLPGRRGKYYFATDNGILYRDTGTSWVSVNVYGTAADVPYAGSTNLAARNVEAALDELDAEKISTTDANAAYVVRADVDGATVGTAQTTTSTTYADLATVGPARTVPTGTRALVIVTARLFNSIADERALMSFAVSGATTAAAGDGSALDYQAQAAGGNRGVAASRVVLVTGLTPGSNTFTAKYRATAGTASFSDRQIVVIPL